jgi:hypothetical protein
MLEYQKIFSFPFKNENMGIENIENALLIFSPNSEFAKCKDTYWSHSNWIGNIKRNMQWFEFNYDNKFSQ